MSYSKGATPKSNRASSFSAVDHHITNMKGFRNFKIAHQKISLDIDLASHSIKGSTDIVIIPLVQNLDYISLDCKKLKINDVLIEKRRCDNYFHDDPLTTLEKNYMKDTNGSSLKASYLKTSIEQSHFLREKFADLNEPSPILETTDDRTKSQLIIKVPSSIKITLQDANLLANFTPITPSFKGGTPSNNTYMNNQESVFTPITIRIDYEVNNPNTGVKFDTFLQDKPYLWNAYTTNAELCSTASYWMPCVNSLDEKSTWEIEINVPRKVKDIGLTKIIGQNDVISSNTNNEKTKSEHKIKLKLTSTEVEQGEKQRKDEDLEEKNKKESNIDDDHDDDDDDDDDEEDDDEDEDEQSRLENDLSNPMNRDIKVCCSEYSTMVETTHPTDLSKKVLSFQIFNPVAPHHIGWAVGAFDVYTLPSIAQLDKPIVTNNTEINEEEQDEYNDDYNMQNNGLDATNQNDHFQENTENIDDINMDSADIIPIQIYALPTADIDEQTILNSTIVCPKIIDFYSKEFGSYPFTSYAMVFLPTVSDMTMDFASLTICNTRLLYRPDIIDLMFETTNQLAWSIANQWSGVNITPMEVNDIWCCIGMAGYMVLQFSKTLLGNNEFKYRLTKFNEQIVEQDWEKSPLGTAFTNASRPISTTSRDLEFIKLKAPMVLYILDRRMTKTERSFGMSRVLPKIFLQAMSGALSNNSLTSQHFQHVCERVNKNKLEYFFQQWVYGSGVPILRVTQRFNKKKMVVEMGIRQCQDKELDQGKVIGEDGFFASALEHIDHPDRNRTSFFTGSMTIRIHEADGTPYEHIVELKDIFTKIEIQYNTKYRRIRNKRLNVGGTNTPSGSGALSSAASRTNLNSQEFLNEQMDAIPSNRDVDSKIEKLGNVLTTRENRERWNLTDFSKTTEGNEFQRQNEAFEWLRIDSDSEWICKIHINQPDYMFASQLQQDGDVEAQLESIRYYEAVILDSPVNSMIYSSILTRTAMDRRYFYGIRLEACRALSKYAMNETDPNNFMGGSRHLIKVFQSLFCLDNSNIPKNNNFSDFQLYFLQKEIPSFLSKVRNERNESPHFIKQFLLDLLTYNENSENNYNDCYYVATLLHAVVDCAIADREDETFLPKVLDQIRRYENLEKWLPTYQLIVTYTIIEIKLKLHVAGLYSFENNDEILQLSLAYANDTKYSDNIPKIREACQDISLLGFQILLIEGGLKNKDVLKYFFESLCFTPELYIKERLVDIFVEALNFIMKRRLVDRFNDDLDYISEKINPKSLNLSNEDEIASLVMGGFEEEILDRKERNMRSTIIGLTTLLRLQFKDYLPLRQLFWDVLHVPTLSLYQRKRLFDVAKVLYTLTDSFEVVLPMPRDRKLVAKIDEDNKVVIKREGILKVHLAPKLKVISRKPSVTFVNPKNNTVEKSNLLAIKDTSVMTGTPSIPSSPATSISTDSSTTVPKIKVSGNKIKLTLGKVSKPKKVRSSRGTINRVGVLPIRFVKISTKPVGKENVPVKKVDISSVPFSNRVQISKANSRAFIIKIKLPSKGKKGDIHTDKTSSLV
ncbi:transcription initiation factor TFIID subunit TAF2 NDAI_0D04850 [Naumovozyma dairenensis CBS 421]|uniref:Transcription initiation factor TFIID subunit 2 n=1 Tax=Naumovozyma dairenensis (strain ATCC 10597 / BCRC 20456 / CBS 421 / NBRC 0211 / NRRL Y-12639) TaxID=1071378 RepID=G0WAI7_NAUDC|nr:hypothetical protein NDAI_0D04850 [Naumovozyma dairenensis CBS 421]CCD24798.1 hypothetical protein NDAI_0D04850 [Naumovozyma dairenensis CBS 421]